MKKQKENQKRNYKNYITPIILSILILGIVGVFATSIITNNEGSLNLNGRNQFTIANYSSIDNIGKINNVLYVQVGNGSDLQAKINQCNSGCTIIIPSTNGGVLALNRTVNLTSGMDLIIQKGTSLKWDTGALPTQITDVQNGTYAPMFYGNQLSGVRIFNYGIIAPDSTYNPSGASTITWINGSSRIDIFGGKITSSWDAYGIYNSQNVKVHDVNIDGSVNAAVWFECVNQGEIYHLQGTVGGAGYEGEFVDLNAYNSNIIISDVVSTGGNAAGQNDQTIDINACQHVTVSNVISTNANKLFNSDTGAGVRFGTCTPFVCHDIHVINSICNNCTSVSSMGTANSSAVFQDGESDYLTAYTKLRIGKSGQQFSTANAYELEVSSLSSPTIFIYPNNSYSNGTNPSDAGNIAFGEGGDTPYAFIRLNGLLNQLEFRNQTAAQFAFPRDGSGLNMLNHQIYNSILNWSEINSATFPVSCPAGSYITQLGTATTCTATSTIYNNLNLNANRILNVSRMIIGSSNTTMSNLDSVLNIVNATAPTVFIFPTIAGANAADSGTIAFGEGGDTISARIRYNGAANQFEFGAGNSPTNRIVLPRDNPVFIVTKNATAATCNAGAEGAIYYNNATAMHYGCNSTAWIPIQNNGITASGTSCTITAITNGIITGATCV